MNIFANVDAEKTNSVSDAPTLISRYTDKLHKRKIKINDMSLHRISHKRTENIMWRTELNIRPPSKLTIGNILRAPRAIEDITNKEVSNTVMNRQTTNAEIKLNIGPPEQIKISLLYEKTLSARERAAPKMPNFNSYKGTLQIRAIIICPLSWIATEQISAGKYWGEAIANAQSIKTAKKPNLILRCVAFIKNSVNRFFKFKYILFMTRLTYVYYGIGYIRE